MEFELTITEECYLVNRTELDIAMDGVLRAFYGQMTIGTELCDLEQLGATGVAL